MWYRIGRVILQYRIFFLSVLACLTIFFGWHAAKVQMSYDFTRAIPTNNEKYQDYQAFRQKFGEDGNLLVVGINTDKFFTPNVFNAAAELHRSLKQISAVTEVLSVPGAVSLVKDSAGEQLIASKIFAETYQQQDKLDSAAAVFQGLPFYKTLLYSPESNAYLFAISVNKDTINSKARTGLVNRILHVVQLFESNTGIKAHVSGLPYIRTTVANRIASEMNFFLIGSIVLSAITLFLFFRSLSATLMSLGVVLMGVVWSIGTMVLFGYKITILNALIPPLVVVIGVPNCIYFLNKYHTAYKEIGQKEKAIVTMVGRMGIVTLFCNIAAAIGFAVFGLTESALLKEFGYVAGLNIMALFLISLVFIPAVLSFLSPPQKKHVRYLDNPFLQRLLAAVERWTFHHKRMVYLITAAAMIFALVGVFRLKSEGFIVDDLPKTDKIYTDLKWFEQSFGGVMPLEIVVDTKKKNGLVRSTAAMNKIAEFSDYIDQRVETARPLSFVEALKFAKQAYYDGDTLSYDVPYDGDMLFLGPYLRGQGNTKGNLQKLVSSFMDSTRQMARISVNMKDIGSKQLPLLLDTFAAASARIFDTATYKVTFTGSSVTFLEGSRFIINGLKDSIIWAFVLITLCMLYLFRSFRILLCSIIPNIVPLIFTAGVMGWVGIPLKPSTVLVFSVALGIVIDVTIRFLINYKQELPDHHNNVRLTLVQTIHHTGISIIYTSLVLIAGFIIFCFSGFGGTQSLGWLTSLTLLIGTITNLVLLPVLLGQLHKTQGVTE